VASSHYSPSASCETCYRAQTNKLFEVAAKQKNIYNRELLAEIAKHGSVQNIKGVPANMKRLFVTAFGVTPAKHLQIQAAFQKYTDNAVSKTINLPSDASVDDVRKIYLMAHKLKCKGITIYRYGCKPDQVLSFSHSETTEPGISSELITVYSEYSGGCIAGTCAF
jgi:ribonucleoside-diphosphate reductase alpha chain